MSKAKQAVRERVPGTAGVWVIVVVLVVAGVGVFVWAWNRWDGMVERAQFGDLLSGVAGAVAFAGMAVALVLQTLELREQRKELGLTRQELRENRKESKAQTEQLMSQAATMEQQVRVTKVQNALLSRQITLTHKPHLRAYWLYEAEQAVLMIENYSKGEAILLAMTPEGPPQLTGQLLATWIESDERPARLERCDVEPGIAVGPGETLRLVALKPVVAVDREWLPYYRSISITLKWEPAQGGEVGSKVLPFAVMTQEWDGSPGQSAYL